MNIYESFSAANFVENSIPSTANPVINFTDMKIKRIFIGAMILLAIGLVTASIGLFTVNPLMAAGGSAIALIGVIGTLALLVLRLRNKSDTSQNNGETNQKLPTKQQLDQKLPLEKLEEVPIMPSAEKTKELAEGFDIKHSVEKREEVPIILSEEKKKELLEGYEKNSISDEQVMAFPCLLKDAVFMLSLFEIQNKNNSKGLFGLLDTWKIVDSSLKLNKDFTLNVLKLENSLLIWKHVDPILKNDSDFMLKASLINHGHAKMIVGSNLKKDANFFIKLFEIPISNLYKKELLEIADESLFKNPDFMSQVIKLELGFNVSELHPELKKDLIFLTKSISHFDRLQVNEIMRSIDPSFLKDPSFILAAMKADSGAYSKAHFTLKSNQDFLLKAMKIDSDILQHFNELKDNEEFMLKVIAIDPTQIRISPALSWRRNFIIQAIEINPKILLNVNSFIQQNSFFLSKAVEKDPQLIGDDDFRLLLSHSASLLAIGLRQDPSLFYHLKQDTSINDNVIEEACILAGLPRDGIGG